MKIVNYSRKNSLLDARLGQECSFADGCYEVLRINQDMYPWAQVKMVSFSQGFSIWNLGQLFVLAQGDRWSNYQKYLFSCVRKNTFPQNSLQMLFKLLRGTLFTVKFHNFIIIFRTPWPGYLKFQTAFNLETWKNSSLQEFSTEIH